MKDTLENWGEYDVHERDASSCPFPPSPLKLKRNRSGSESTCSGGHDEHMAHTSNVHTGVDWLVSSGGIDYTVLVR